MKRLDILILTIAVLTVGVKTTKQPEPQERPKDILVIDDNLFHEKFIIYTSKHEIVNIIMPLNAINFNDREDNDISTTIFFVEADIKDGVAEYRGISILKNKVATKILETGTDAAASRDSTKLVYIAATDGIYIYNGKDNKVEKYGTITDSLTAIAKVNGSDIIYVLTDENELFKVTENGNKKDLVTEEHAKQIVVDYKNNLYFHNGKYVYVYNGDTVKQIEDLPSATYLSLIKPPFENEGVPVVLDQKTFVVFPNRSSEVSEFEFDVKPSAYAMEATLIQYYGYKKSIYEYNILNLVFGGLLPIMTQYFDSK